MPESPPPVDVVVIGAVRDDVLASTRAALATLDASSRDRGPALVLVVGSVENPDPGENHTLESTDAVEAALLTACDAMRRLSNQGEKVVTQANVVAILDDDAALGDPSRVMDSVLAGSLVSWLRACTLELTRGGTAVTTLFTPTAPAQPAGVGGEAVGLSAHIARALTEESSATGQACFVGDGRQIGRLLP